MKSPKKPQLDAPATAERISMSLFAKDTAAIKRLRGGLFADTETLANTSELIRFLLRTAPAKLDAKRFLACREEMQSEDGRTKRGK